MNANMKKQMNPKKHPRNQREGQEVTNYVHRPIGIPDTQYTVIRYVDLVSFTGSTSSYTFRANSLFDPDFTSTGHQPYYFDQFIASYEKYRVFKTHIKLRVTNISQTDVSEVVLVPGSQIPTLTSLSLAREMPRSKCTGILPAFQAVPIEISLSLRTKTVLGLQSRQIYDQDYGAVFNANPVELWYYTIYCWGLSTNNVLVDVEMLFECEFYDRAPVTLSLAEKGARIHRIYTELSKNEYRPIAPVVKVAKKNI